MKATLKRITLITALLGFAPVRSVLAQPVEAPATIESAPLEKDTTPLADVAPRVEESAEKPAEIKPIDQGKGLYKSIKGGEWLLTFGFFGMLLGSLARFAFGKKWAFLNTKAGGYTIAGFTGMGILGGLIVEAGTFSMSMLPTALAAMLAAMAFHGPAKGLKKKLSGDGSEISAE